MLSKFCTIFGTYWTCFNSLICLMLDGKMNVPTLATSSSLLSLSQTICRIEKSKSWNSSRVPIIWLEHPLSNIYTESSSMLVSLPAMNNIPSSTSSTILAASLYQHNAFTCPYFLQWWHWTYPLPTWEPLALSCRPHPQPLNLLGNTPPRRPFLFAMRSRPKHGHQ